MVKHIRIEAKDWKTLNHIRVFVRNTVVFRYIDGRFARTSAGWKTITFDGENRFAKFEEYLKKLSDKKDGVVWLKWNK